MWDILLEVDFTGTVIEWRGPAPYLFVAVPDDHAAAIRQAARLASYGWGVVPVQAQIGTTAFATSLFPRGGGYLLPLKVAVRRAEDIAMGDEVAVTIGIRTQR